MMRVAFIILRFLWLYVGPTSKNVRALRRVIFFTLKLLTPSSVLTFTVLSSLNPSMTICIDTLNDDMY